MPQSIYYSTPLQNPSQHIRLLKITSALDHDRFTIEAWPLTQVPKYTAISYTWGAPYPKSTIAIKGEPFLVTRNAQTALRQVVPRAYEHGMQYIWMDAICIDQDSLLEKNAQVPLMGDIYRTASKVFACVGEHADGSRNVMLTAMNINHPVKPSHSDVSAFLERF